MITAKSLKVRNIAFKIKDEISSYDSKTLAELEKAVAILMSGNQSDRALSNAIKNWLQNEKPDRASFENYKLGFLTQKGSIRTRLASVKIFNEHPWSLIFEFVNFLTKKLAILLGSILLKYGSFLNFR